MKKTTILLTVLLITSFSYTQNFIDATYTGMSDVSGLSSSAPVAPHTQIDYDPTSKKLKSNAGQKESYRWWTVGSSEAAARVQEGGNYTRECLDGAGECNTGKSIRMTPTPTGSADGKKASQARIRFDFPSGFDTAKQYKISFWYRLEASTTTSGAFNFNIKTTGGTNQFGANTTYHDGTASITTSEVNDATNWTLKEVVFSDSVGFAATGDLHFQLAGQNTGFNAVVYIDDVSISEYTPPTTCTGLGLTQDGGGTTEAIRWLLQNGCATTGFVDGSQWATADSNDHTIDINSGTESGYIQLSFNVAHDGSENSRGLKRTKTEGITDLEDILEITTNPNNDFLIVWVEHNWNKTNCAWSGSRRIDALLQYNGTDWNTVQNLVLTFNRADLLESNVTLLKYCPQTININYTPVDNTASVDDLSVFNFNYTPNPTRDILNLSAAKNINKVDVYSLLGQRVLSSEINATKSTLNIAHLKTGIYLLNVTIDDAVGAYKIVKK